jgi:dTDP-4-dehydrorhamnose reductase
LVVTEEKILLLGASSWLGYLLAHKLDAMGCDQLVGTVRKGIAPLPGNMEIAKIRGDEDYHDVMARTRPAIVVNFLRGEEESDFDIHRSFAAYCMSESAYYVYVSSILALDAYQEIELTENLSPKGKSPYGRFKGRCENYLQDCDVRHLILRFASVQGWVPHRQTRNEIFLHKISSGQSVTVDLGVIQNRLFADDLVDMIAALISNAVEGVVHLGTDDSSSEIDFLRREAAAFGWNPRMVMEGEIRDVNLVARPKRVLRLLGSKYARSEQDTINSLLKSEGLSKYKRAAMEKT